MSKIAHDKAVAELRRQVSTDDKPWFISCTRAMEKENLRGGRCLDLCCGNGEYSRILRDRFRMEVTCADYIPSHLREVRQEGFDTIEVDLDQEVETVDRIAAAHQNSFDVVVCLAAVEHVFNSDNLLRFAHTVLKSGGILIINTPNIAFLGYRLFSLFSANRPFGEGHHVRFWDFRFLRTNLFVNGFRVDTDHRGFFTLPQGPLQRAFRNIGRPVKWVAAGFYVCHALQHVPFIRGLVTDELTLICTKEDTPPIGFDYLTVKNKIEGCRDLNIRHLMIKRLKVAHQRGWLKEHLYLARFVESLDA